MSMVGTRLRTVGAVARKRRRRRFETEIARDMWEHDGKPERDPYDPTTVGWRDYDEWTSMLFDSLERRGLVIVRGRKH